jgi:hypothetical protein
MPLSSVLGAQSLVRPGVCTSSTRPASPFEGQVIYETDTNQVLVYSGTAWVMLGDLDTPPGLQLIKTQTIGSAVTSVTVSDAFSADFDNYRIVLGKTVMSAAGNSMFMTINGTTGSTYNYAGDYQAYSNSKTNFGAANSSSGFWLGVSGGNFSAVIDITSPYLSSPTSCFVMSSGADWNNNARNYDSNSASSVSFTITQASGPTMTGGTIRVYGYRNS